VKQKEAPVGITTFSKLRDVKKGVFEASPIFDMDPVFAWLSTYWSSAIERPIPMRPSC